MRASYVLVSLCSAALTAALILACGDDAPTTADAAEPVACNCPAAEAPITKSRVTRIEVRETIGGLKTEATAVCPEGAIAISGGCAIEERVRGVELQRSEGFVDRRWECRWDNTTVSPVTGIASVICLLPAPK